MSHIRTFARLGTTLFALCALLAPITSTAQQPPASPAPAKQTLYARLGGYDAIALVTDDFITRLATDPKLSKFFTGLSDNSKGRVRQLVVDQLCAATGGPCIYIGRDMKTSHKGLNITEAEWQIAVTHLGESLNRYKVGPAEQKDLAAALVTLKPDIVQGK
jgi:hemoglobin